MAQVLTEHKLYDEDNCIVFEETDELTIKLNDITFKNVTLDKINEDEINVEDSQMNIWTIKIKDIVELER